MSTSTTTFPTTDGAVSGFVVAVQFGIDPVHWDAFMREMVANARSSREREPGCLVFDRTVSAWILQRAIRTYTLVDR